MVDFKLIELLRSGFLSEELYVMLDNGLESLIYTEVGRHDRRLISVELLRVKDHIRKVVLLHRRFCVRCINEVIRLRIFALQKVFHAKLLMQLQVEYLRIIQLQSVYVIDKLRFCVKPENEPAFISGELFVQFVGNLFQVKYCHEISPQILVSTSIFFPSSPV